MTHRKTIELAAATFGKDWPGAIDLVAEFAEAERLVMSAEYEQAADLLLEIAVNFHYGGYPRLVWATTEDMRSLLGRNLTPTKDAWALNCEALALGVLGKRRDEKDALETMLARGRRLGDNQIVSTALQNLAIVAFDEDDVERAVKLASDAFEMKVALNDSFAAAQILLNLATTMVSRGQGDVALEALSAFRFLYDDLNDPGLLGSLHGITGQAAAKEGRFEDAEPEFRLALKFARKAADLRKEVTALQNLGELERDRGDLGRSMRWYRNAIKRAEAADAPPQLEMLYRGLALSLHRSGRNREALEWLDRARRAAERFGEHRLYAGATVDSGAILVTLGEMEEALPLFEEALTSFKSIGERAGQVQALTGLSVASESLGDEDRAEATLSEAIELADSNEDRLELLRRLAELFLINHNPVRAAEVFEREFETAATLGLREQAHRAATGAALLASHGGYVSSISLYTRALNMYVQLRDTQRAFGVRNDRALALAELERFDEAVVEFRRARTTGRRAKNRAMELQASMNLAETQRRAGDTDQALADLDAASWVAQSLGDRKAEAEILLLRGLSLFDRGDLGEAERNYLAAFEIGENLDDRDLRAASIGGLAGLDFSAGRYRRAASRYKRAVALTAETTRQRVEDAGGYLVSLSAAGIETPLEYATQQLVDLAQEVGVEIRATEAACQAAHWWLGRRELDTAASLYSVAIVLGLVGAVLRDPADDAIYRGALLPISLMVLSAQQELDDPDTFYDNVLDLFRHGYEDFGPSVHEFVAEATTAAIKAAARADKEADET